MENNAISKLDVSNNEKKLIVCVRMDASGKRKNCKGINAKIFNVRIQLNLSFQFNLAGNIVMEHNNFNLKVWRNV